MMVIAETHRVHEIRYPRFYVIHIQDEKKFSSNMV